MDWLVPPTSVLASASIISVSFSTHFSSFPFFSISSFLLHSSFYSSLLWFMFFRGWWCSRMWGINSFLCCITMNFQFHLTLYYLLKLFTKRRVHFFHSVPPQETTIWAVPLLDASNLHSINFPVLLLFILVNYVNKIKVNKIFWMISEWHRAGIGLRGMGVSFIRSNYNEKDH
jgi:hypothetical protein